MRVVSWNIEKGKRWEKLLACLQCDELQSAHVICLNEVDEGMARSQNKRVAFELASRLNLDFVFGPVYREFTKGIGDERLVPGENEIGIQGNAILSRLPILEKRNITLPVCHDPFNDEEKREGGRSALVVRIDCGRGESLLLANTHLEVFTTTKCRSRQMAALLKEIGAGPALIVGDWNTNTFDRGTAWRTFRSLVRLIDPGVRKKVLDPVAYEPLFGELRRNGFEWEGFNDGQPTCFVDLGSLEDRRYVPRHIRDFVLRRIHGLPLRLDWIAGRGVRALSPGKTLSSFPETPSDHLPIMCDVGF